MVPCLIKKHQKIFNYLLFFISLFLPLILAIYNGYIFYFYDTTSYVLSAFSGQTSPFRPMGYSYFLQFTSLGYSLWLVAISQSIIASYIIFRFLKIFITKKIFIVHFITIILLSIFTSFGWFVSFLMPDIFISLGALALIVIILEQSSFWSKMAPITVLFISAIVHTSHPPILFLSTLIILPVAWLINKELFNKYLKNSFLAMVTIIIAFSVIKINNSQYNFTYNHAGPIFIVARLEETGILQDFLTENCHQENYQLCSSLPTFKKTRKEGFLWQPDSPLNLVGWNNSQNEYNKIVNQVFREPKYFFRFFVSGLITGAQSLSRLELDTFGPNSFQGTENLYYRHLTHFFPIDEPFFENSKQTKDSNWLQKNSTLLMVSLILISIFIIIYLLIKLTYPKIVILAVTLIFITVISNALVTATFSVVSDSRYTARISWIIPLAMLALIKTSYNMKSPVKLP